MKRDIIVIFGGSGDLTKRKLIPALYTLYRTGSSSPERIIGVGRSSYNDESYRVFLKENLIKFIKEEEYDLSAIDSFINRVIYFEADPSDPEIYSGLKARITEDCSCDFNDMNMLYYIATPPKMYEVIPRNLGQAGMAAESSVTGYRRVIVEKPFGYDLESALFLNSQLTKYFKESQIYRIDHFLGKETVQNILAFRFANGIFEPLWNRNYIDRVEITAVENIGIERRGGYYEGAGALRDMVQNHLVQLLALCAMEPPVSYNQKDLRDEVVKVYKAFKPLSQKDLEDSVVRGQYTSSQRGNAIVQSYRDEVGVSPTSTTETFVSMKMEIQNWRWSGVPFYIRTGKQMPTKVTEIVIHFKETPHSLFASSESKPIANQIIIRIQPNEGIVLKFGLKVPGAGFEIKEVPMDFTYDKLGSIATEDAYARLIAESMKGDSSLFTRSDAVEASWRFFDPVLKYWKSGAAPLYGYPAGTWGPLESEKVLGEGKSWTNPCKNLTNTHQYCEL